jgi:hypothetical protein
MSIRWDAVLTRHVAEALDRLVGGSELRAIRLDGLRRDLFLMLGDRTLVWRLHPDRGHLLERPRVDPDPGDLRHPARIRRVQAPPDERWVRFELLPRRGGPAHDLIVELLGNQWNAVVVETSSRIIRHVLWSRSGGRALRVGARYEPAAAQPRRGIDGSIDARSWRGLLEGVPRDRRGTTLVREVAWTSPLLSSYLLAEDVGAPDERRWAVGHERWVDIVRSQPTDRTYVLEMPQGLQPYPVALPGVRCRSSDGVWSAFEIAAAAGPEGTETPSDVSLLAPELVRRIHDAADRARRRVAQLEEELSGLGDAMAWRTRGDLILARYGEIPQGCTEAMLEGFDGQPVRVSLDPGLPPQGNAARHYAEAARIERARDRLPELILAARRNWRRLDDLAQGAREGTVSADDLLDALPERADRKRRRHGPDMPLPYRTFRSSGDLEIRVGRGARHNDELTFKHAAPGDVWLHARHAAGAHVILRWPGPGNPPARDLEEAAILAATHSRARTSGSVPVDWTFRKYVRKPRGAAAGAVVPERVSTLFVRPDAALARTLAEDGSRHTDGGIDEGEQAESR